MKMPLMNNPVAVILPKRSVSPMLPAMPTSRTSSISTDDSKTTMLSFPNILSEWEQLLIWLDEKASKALECHTQIEKDQIVFNVHSFELKDLVPYRFQNTYFFSIPEFGVLWYSNFNTGINTGTEILLINAPYIIIYIKNIIHINYLRNSIPFQHW